MTERKSFILISPSIRQNAINAVRAALDGWRVSISKPTRTDAQNDKMWAMLSDVARASPEGHRWTPETWKAAFMHYLGHQVIFCQGLEDSGPFPIGFRSSKLSVGQMADLITCIQEYGDRHKVAWTEVEASGLDSLRARAEA